MELADLLLEELRLQPQQWELKPSSPGHLPELYCLVHEDWLSSAQDGGPLPLSAPELDPTEIHWLLQPSCEGPPTKPWKRLFVVCVAKSQKFDAATATRLPVFQGAGFSQHSIFHFLTQVAQENQLWSWKQLMATLQGHADGCPPPPPDQLLSSSMVIHHIVKCLYGMSVKQLRVNGSTNPRGDGQHDSKGPTNTPCHANFLQPKVVLETERAFYFVYPYARFTLFDVVTHSPAVLLDSYTKSKFVLFQLLTLLAHCHAHGITLGDITMWDLYVDSRLWVQLGLPHSIFRNAHFLPASKTGGSAANLTAPARPMMDGTSVPPEVPSPPPSSAPPTSRYTPPNLCLSEAMMQWRHGRLSNFDYLMFLNHLAGRRVGDPNNHPIMPWVMDFTSRSGGLRDLTKSKYRIEKGDDQLDYTYTSTRDEAWRCNEKDGSTPHHIGNISTDVTYYVYMARRTCKEVLCSRVRPQWVPGEYPGTMERMYKWSPDECIPEFFTDPVIFKSIHPDLPDLAIPSWCSSPEELVEVHRGMLEGDHVSSQLHRWIDLMFGFQLAGEAALKSKNVYLTLVDNHTALHSSGVVQLFRSSHPKRVLGTCAPVALLEWQTFLAQSSVATEASFDTQQVEKFMPGGRTAAPSATDDMRTLEAILCEQSKQSAPPTGEGVLEDSFEHVAPDELINEGTTPSDMFMSTRTATIDYGVSPTDAVQGKAVLSAVGGQSRGMPLNWLRVKKPSVDSSSDHHAPHLEDVAENQRALMAFPKGTKMNTNLASLEEVMHFVMKSCRQTKEVFKKQWELQEMTALKDSRSFCSVVDLLRLQEEDPLVAMSFSQRVAMDVAAVTCTIVEMCLNKQLRAAISAFPSLYQRACAILEMRKGGMLQLPVHLESLVECVFAPDSDRGLPELSATLILQQFVTLVPFPSYFGTLYSFFSEVEQLCRKYSLSGSNLKSFPRPKADFDALSSSESCTIVTFVQERLPSLLSQLDKDGQGLLLLHLMPLFHFPETCFEATVTFVNEIGQYLSKRRMEQLFLTAVLRIYDMAVEPYQKVQLFSRPVVDTLLCRFGLTVFLQRFLGFMLDIVVDPSSLTSKHHTAARPLPSTERSSDYRPAVMAEFAYAMNDKLPNDDVDNDDDSDPEVEVEAELPKASLLLSHAPPTTVSPPTPVEEEEEVGVGGDPLTGGSAPHVVETPAVTIGERKNTGFSSFSRPGRPERKTGTRQTEPSGRGPPGTSTGPSSKGPMATTAPSPFAPRSSSVPEDIVKTGTKREIFETPPTASGQSHTHNGIYLDDMEANMPKELEGVATTDPQKQAIDTSVVEVVVDTVCWLVHRFGPLLATRYIIKPLRDNLYRSFLGLKGQRAMGVRCLKAFASQCNTDAVPLKLYLTFAEDLVSAATNKMTSRAEAGLAASLALVKITIEVIKVDKQFAKRLCDTYFIPLIQLISSHVSFPSGGPGRAAICHGTVLILQQLAKGVVNACDREAAMEVMESTLQSFFNCFGVFQQRGGTSRSKSKSPTPLGEEVEDVCSQLCHTFNHAMAHAAYIPFCLTLGQINVGKLLGKKVDLIEQMAYSYDEVIHKGVLPCVFHDGDYIDMEKEGVATESSDSEVEKGSDDEEDLQGEAALTLGPLGSIHVIKKLDKDATSFGRSNWFIDLREGEGEAEKPGEGVATGESAKGSEGVEAGTGTLRRGGDRLTITSWRPRPFKQAEDTVSEGVPSAAVSTLSSAAFEEKYKDAIAQMETKKNKKSTTDDGMGLPGNWLNTWESQLTLSQYHEPSFHNFEAKTVQTIMGHHSDVKTLTVPDSEQFFVSSGKDKSASVKLWTVHSLFSSSAVTPTQEYKCRNVFAVELLDQVQQLITCDGNICLWDIQTAFCLQQFNFQKNNRIVAMAMVNSPQSALCTASGDGVLRFIDLRSKSIAYSWKTTVIGGVCSAIATYDNWVAVGTDSGLVSCSDIRMGEPINSWKLAETPGTAAWGDNLARLKATKRGALLACIGSGYISLWKPTTAKHIWSVRGHGSSVLCLETVGEELLSTSGNTVVVYPSFELVKEPVPYQCSIKSKLKGSISALAALPQNRVILGGTEGGQLLVMS